MRLRAGWAMGYSPHRRRALAIIGPMYVDVWGVKRDFVFLQMFSELIRHSVHAGAATPTGQVLLSNLSPDPVVADAAACWEGGWLV